MNCLNKSVSEESAPNTASPLQVVTEYKHGNHSTDSAAPVTGPVNHRSKNLPKTPEGQPHGRQRKNDHVAREPKAQGGHRVTVNTSGEEPRTPPAPASRSGRAVNANHLLGFQYSSGRHERGGRHSGSRSPFPTSGGWRGGGRPQHYDRNKFLQANFRFLVSDAVDVAAFSADPDKMFDWEDVVQVEMTSTVPVQCPISLDSPPICPHITPCGHVFSFHSIMTHLIRVGGEELRRAAPCPLCFTPLVARELRLVKVHQVTEVQVNHVLSLTLLSRPKNSIMPSVAVPNGSISEISFTSVEDAFNGNRFAKFIVTSDANTLWAAAAAELAEHASKLVTEGGLESALEAPFVYAALDALAVRAGRWAAHRVRAFESAGPPGSSGESPAAAEAATAAGAEVRRMFVAAQHNIKASEQFPQLGVPAASTLSSGNKKPTEVVHEFPELGTAMGYTPGSSKKKPLGPEPAASNTENRTCTANLSHRQQHMGASDSAGGLRQSCSSSEREAEKEVSEPAYAEFAFEPAFSDDDDDGGLVCVDKDDHQSTKASGGTSPGHNETASGMPIMEHARSQSIHSLGTSPTSLWHVGADSELLGTSPTSAKVNMTDAEGHYFTYQAADGQWVFLHPLNLRCLLHEYGSYAACPPTLAAPVLELEDAVQSVEARRRLRFLGHLPLGGTFRLAEVDLGGLLSQSTLAHFADELSARARRRRRREKEERQAVERDRVAAAEAIAARAGPGMEELQAMPALSAATAAMTLVADEVTEASPLGTGDESAASAGGPTTGTISFASIAKLGYAATGPTLGSSPPMASSVPSLGAWSNKMSVSALTSSIKQASEKQQQQPTQAQPTVIVPSFVSLTRGGVNPMPQATGGLGVGPWGGARVMPMAANMPSAGAKGNSMRDALVGNVASHPEPESGAKRGANKKGTLLFATPSRRY